MLRSESPEIERCGFLCVHEDTVQQVLKQMPDDETLYDLAELFKIFGDSTRIRILFELFEQDVSVGQLAADLSITQSAVSHQLKILKQSKLVDSRREGKTVFYSLDDDHVKMIIAMGKEHIEEE